VTKKKEPEYTGPPEFESLVLPNSRNTRNYLASIADQIPHTELVERAEAAGLDLSDAKSKTEAVERVRDAVHPVVPPAE
jgi:hypothetical protein